LLLLIFRQFTARKKQQQQKEREREREGEENILRID
jgi:hypothetical protein